ncbi:larval cuticle protein 65Ag1 [Drosophila sechellia]|uniref:GM14765 n=2 Tax=melanogaster subgroup TaxID=32351 RepID=B4HUR0_DROSE|nr:larval cuticle protein 65Ag1 [Drosophila sechellia]XP_033161028.1 larval cuticle protein 65Ag1 [Drosophila mauritiana]EDW50681.1 GM14765 [Drosophila sechellia]
MKCILVFTCLSIAMCLAAPAPDAEIVDLVSDVNADSYSYKFETSDGTKQEQHGSLKSLGPEEDVLQVAGSFSFVGDDGQTHAISYVADENGFQPQGEDIPHL